MKTYFLALFYLLFPYLVQAQENTIKPKQINIVRTNFRDMKSGEIVNKTVLFKDGKLFSIKTSDVIHSFFYNPKGLLDMTVKEKVGSNWKEVINYVYDEDNQIIKFIKKYQEGNDYVTKMVLMSYQGARIKVTTQKSNSHELILDDIEYVVENGLIVRRTSRDRNQQIINKTEYVYTNDNLVRHKGLVGDKSTKIYTFDDKNSINQMIVKNIFGDNYKIIVPILSFHEDEFDIESISNNNELTYTLNQFTKGGKFKYNTINYPSYYVIIEENGMIKTEKTFIYE